MQKSESRPRLLDYEDECHLDRQGTICNRPTVWQQTSFTLTYPRTRYPVVVGVRTPACISDISMAPIGSLDAMLRNERASG